MNRRHTIHIERADSETINTSFGLINLLTAWPDGDPPANGWPILWVLDAENAFTATVETLRAASSRSDATNIVPAVVVGIKLRVPENQSVRSLRQACFQENSNSFRAELNGDIRSYVHGRFACDRDREVLLGHSLSAWFALRSAIADAGRFRAVAAVSPSLWNGSDELLKGIDRFPRDQYSLSVLLAVGQYEQGLAPWEESLEGSEITLERRKTRRMVDGCKDLHSQLIDFGMDSRFHLLAGGDHATSRILALPYALRLLALN